MTSRSPLDDLDARKARLRQRIPEITGNATHEYVAITGVRGLDVPHADAEAAPLGPPPAADDPRWTPLEPGQPWGHGNDLLVWGYPADGGNVTWLHARVEVPPGWADDDVLLGLDDPRLGEDRAAVDGVGFEGLVHLDGAVHAGMDDWHREVLLPKDAAGRSYDVLVRATTASRRPFAGLRLLRRHRDTWRLGILGTALLGVAEQLGDGDVTAVRLREVLDEVYRGLDLAAGWNSEPFRRSASAVLPGLEAALAQLPRSDEATRPSVVATGHAHLDVAWLWPVWRTRQKVAHTVATALNLMDRYPGYHFSLSAPQTWLFVEEADPDLFSRMASRAAEGRLEPVGVFWLESDGSLPSAESFVRQVRHGSRFYETRLGRVPNAAWLPDSFGFTAALPTILAAFGVRALMTTKLSWNRINRMPADTFRWRGPDGSTVLAHFVTASSKPVEHPADPAFHVYTGDMSPAEVWGLWQHYHGKDVSSEVLYLYGHGDGGGGPTEAMVATAEVLADLPGFPRVRTGRAEDFFARLLDGAGNDPRLPTWTGDLYMEGHRGTLTSQQRTKRGNRDGELALREAEWANAWAALDGGPDRQGELDGAWETLLRNQFHDILPGSGIPRVPADAAVEHAEVVRVAHAVRDTALGLTSEGGGALVVVNPLPWVRSGVAELADGDVAWATAPPFGVHPLRRDVPAPVAPSRVTTDPADGDGFVLDNGRIRVRVDGHGEVVSLHVPHADLEFVLPGRTANALALYEDRPLYWDAWDIDPFYSDKASPLRDVATVESVEPLDGHGLRAGVRVTLAVGRSRIVQTLTLDAGSNRLEVDLDVDWHERNRLLRAAFPLSPNARHATLGRQVGSVEVPTHRNTSWEAARFEVAAHGWCHVGDDSGGVALLTDAIYGHSVEQVHDGQGVVVGLSLLKSASWPDPAADEGRHRLRYALAAHAGTWQAARIPQQALELAVPLHVLPLDSPERSLLAVDAGHVVADTVKTAWDGDGLVVRLHETHNRRGVAVLSLDRPVRSAHRSDAAERDLEALDVTGRTVRVPVRPHELVTVRLRF